MRRRILTGTLVAAFLWVAPVSRGDVWDLGGDNDNDIGSDNEIVQGLEQVHDLAAQQGGTVEDVDFYRFQIPPASSWEFIIDSMTGDVGNAGTAPDFDVVASDGIGITDPGVPLTNFGIAQHATSVNFSGTDVEKYVRVGGPACALSCTANDQYRFRAYETTLSVPRYNNANGQLTVLVLQNNGGTSVDLRIYAYGAAGAFLGELGLQTLAPNEVRTFNVATANGGVLNNTAGGLRILHYGGYGQLTGKAVALESATGFTFDTPVLSKPR